MRQYFYLVTHIVEDTVIQDKIFLQEHDAIRWGKTLATAHPDYIVNLYKQEIARTATIKYVKQLTAYTSK